MKHWLDRLQPSESMVIGGVAIFIGLASGFGVWVFKRLIDLFHFAAFGSLGADLSTLSHWMVVLVVGIILHYFIPSLFIGAMLGGAFGWIANGIFPGLNIAPPAFAMVGMAAVLAGAVHAPLTAILLLFEMTNDYRIILPLMFAVIVSLVISEKIQKDSVYTLGLSRKGIRLDRGRDLEVLETLTVKDVMQPAPIQVLDTDTVAEAHDLLTRTRHHGAPVVNHDNQLAGILTLEDIDHIPVEQWASRTVCDTCTRELMVAYPDETLGMALRRMGTRDVGRLPVVDRS